MAFNGRDQEKKKFYFTLKNNSPINRIGSYGFQTVWTDKCQTKKEVRERYSSNQMSGHKVTVVFTEDQFIKKYGIERAAQIKRYWNA